MRATCREIAEIVFETTGETISYGEMETEVNPKILRALKILKEKNDENRKHSS